jgi:hypothetical protein
MRDRDPAEDALDPAELYEFLSGEPAPQALAEAAARASGGEEGVEARAPNVEGREAARAQETEDVSISAPRSQRREDGEAVLKDGIVGPRSDFLRDYCQATDRNRLWVWVTGDSWIRTKGTNYFRTAAYASIGEITFRFNAWDAAFIHWQFPYYPGPDWDPGQNIVLKPGQYMWNRVDCRNCTVEAKVSEAAGDTYDFCTNWHY